VLSRTPIPWVTRWRCIETKRINEERDRRAVLRLQREINGHIFRFKKENRQQYGIIVDGVARILKRGTPTKFAQSAISIYVLRSVLCLQGWSWAAAHQMATAIVLNALSQIGAKRRPGSKGNASLRLSVFFCDRMFSAGNAVTFCRSSSTDFAARIAYTNGTSAASEFSRFL
jgi:hypothetical protein